MKRFYKFGVALASLIPTALMVGSSASAERPAVESQGCETTTTTTVTPKKLAGWNMDNPSYHRANGDYEFTAQGLDISTTAAASSTDKMAAYQEVDTMPLKDVRALGYKWSQATGNIPVSYQLPVDTNADGVFEGFFVWEPAYNGYPTATTGPGFTGTFDILGGNWWSNASLGLPSGMGYTSYGTIANLLALHPDTVVGRGFSLGSGVYSIGTIDEFVFDCDITLFRAETVQECAEYAVVHTTDLEFEAGKWDDSATRSAGHNVVQADGLHVSTDTDVTGSPDPRKAAAYTDASFPLTELGTEPIADMLDWTGTNPDPGLQLVVDFDADGTADGILVGEPIYGNDWWLSTDAAQFVKDDAPTNGGGGSTWSGSINQWLQAFPFAAVQGVFNTASGIPVDGVGYSLGSSVNGKGVISQITLGCVHYTFGLAPRVLVPAQPPIEDPCGVDDATWVDQTSTEQVTWTEYIDQDGREHAVATVAEGSVFDDGRFEVDFGVAPDSNTLCPTNPPDTTAPPTDPTTTTTIVDIGEPVVPPTPPATAPTTIPTPGVLPETGGNSMGIIWLATAIVVAGLGLVIFVRRRDAHVVS